MAGSLREQCTQLLAAADQRGPQVTAELVPLIYDELRRMARQQMVRERAGHTLQPTALVHEAFMRLVGDGEQRWENRRHFFAAAATAMRRILVDHARQRGRQKRGGDAERVPLEDVSLVLDEDAPDALALDEALQRLEQYDPRKAEIASLRYFAGLTIDETAKTLDISATTVKAEWSYALAWLHRELAPDCDDGAAPR